MLLLRATDAGMLLQLLLLLLGLLWCDASDVTNGICRVIFYTVD